MDFFVSVLLLLASMSEVMSVVSVFLQLLALLVAGVWSVSAIRSTTDRLTTTIANLEVTVEKIGSSIPEIEKKANDHEIRLVLLERKSSK